MNDVSEDTAATPKPTRGTHDEPSFGAAAAMFWAAMCHVVERRTASSSGQGVSHPTTGKSLHKTSVFAFYKPSMFGILRIGAWAFGFLYLAGVVFARPDDPIPWNNVSSPARVFTMLRDMDDPRGFRALDDYKFNVNFKVAWISGSATQVIWPLNSPDGKTEVNEFMPMFVQPRIKEAVGRDVDILLYVVQAGSVLDKYLALVHALGSNADLIMFEVNPAYDFTANITTYRSNLFAANAQDMLKRTERIATQLLLSSPAEVIWSLLQRTLPALRDRWAYAKWLSDRLTIRVRRAVATPSPAAPLGADRAYMFNARHAPAFWSLHRPRPNDNYWLNFTDRLADGNVKPFTAIQAALANGEPIRGGAGASIIQRVVAEIARSRIPAIVYLSPIGPDASGMKGLSMKYEEMQHGLKTIGLPHRFNKDLCVITSWPKDFIAEQRFSDEVHIRRSEPMASEMSRLMINFTKNRTCP
jgi:hypothetical protein